MDLVSFDAIHETKFDAIGIVVLQTALCAVIVLTAYVCQEEAEILLLSWIIFDAAHVAKALAVVLELLHLCYTCCLVHALEH